jgi:hypothetical protein
VGLRLLPVHLLLLLLLLVVLLQCNACAGTQRCASARVGRAPTGWRARGPSPLSAEWQIIPASQ